MIKIAGAQPHVDTSSWPAVARKTFYLKNNSPYDYQYESLRHLSFEMGMRSAIIEAAVALSRSGLLFSTYKLARCNDQFWNLTELGGFKIKEGVEPAAGIRDIFVNGSLYSTECSTATMIVFYRAVLASIGDSHFNRLFSGVLLYDWQLDDDFKIVREPSGEAFPGDLLYFNNPDYSPLNPEWRGENVVKIDDDLYYGHPMGVVNAQTIIFLLNRARRPGSMVSAYLMEAVDHPDFLYLSQFAPGSRPFITAKIGRKRLIAYIEK